MAISRQRLTCSTSDALLEVRSYGPVQVPRAGLVWRIEQGVRTNRALVLEESVSLQQTMEIKIREAFQPIHLQIINESAMHNVPPGSESHFRLVIVSRHFEGQSSVQRHRAIYGVLEEEMKSAIHALGIQTITPGEWAEENIGVTTSPPCLGGDGSRA